MCQREIPHRVVAPGPVDRLEIGEGPTSELELVRGPTVPYDPTYHLLWRPDRVVRSVRSFRPDVLEVHSAYVAALGALASPRESFGIRTMVWHSDHLGTYLEPWLEPRLGERPTGTLLAPLWAGVRALTARTPA
ncbi:MAG: glycosyltransferase family 1 protein, partial [Proteobacteria bacterium]